MTVQHFDQKLPAELPVELTARTRLTSRQAGTFWLTGLGLFVLTIFFPRLGVEIIIGAAMLLYTGHMLFRAVLFVSGTRDRPPAPEPPTPDDALPVYTLVVALYREANMAEQIVGAMTALRYPAKKLDLIFALEPDDHDTIKAIRAAMPAQARIVLARGNAPKAKPRALNTALAKARGEFLAIYDAEDRPDPDQLLKAVAALQAGPPELACVQAELRPDDERPNVLQRLFALDFCLWFEVMLWGLERQSMPVPLGGTSNHFRGIM